MTVERLEKPKSVFTSQSQLSERGQAVLRELLAVWLQFERQLNRVPILRRLEQGTFSIDDYKTLLLNLRPQVVEGARWITRAASSFDAEYTSLRSVVIHHAQDEHRDFEMLEHDFISLGGDIAEMQKRERNVGTEALNAFLMNQSSQSNPVDLLGAMFIIEGLGEKMASRWAQRIQESAGVKPSSTRFLGYHGANDENHLSKLYAAIDEYVVDDKMAARVVKTARVVARLYALQLEELDNV